MFDAKSRYAKLTPYVVMDARGRAVSVVPAAERPAQSELGRHLRRQGERIDHLANFYLADPAGYWRICELNDVMLPEALSEALEILIPTKSG
jgi:hypothetical protein